MSKFKSSSDVVSKKLSDQLRAILIDDDWISDELKNNDVYEKTLECLKHLEKQEKLLDLYRELYNDLGEDVLDVNIYDLEKELKEVTT